MKKFVLLTLVLTLAVSGVFAGGRRAQDDPDAPVRFLMSAMMTGPNAESGRQVAMAARTAEWYINEVLGGFPSLGGRRVELVIVDSTSDAAMAAAPFEAALGTGTFSVVIGNPNSAISLVNQPIAEAFRIPQVLSSSANILLSQGGFQYSFQLNATPLEVVPVQMSFIRWYAGLLGVAPEALRIGIIYADDAWGTDQAATTNRLLRENGFNVVFSQSYNIPTFTDATPLVTALMHAGVDVLMPASYPSDLALIFTAKGALGFNPLVIGGGAAMTWPSLYVDLGAATNGIVSADGFVWDQRGAREHPGWMRMNEWHERTFGEFIAGQGGPTLVSVMLAYTAIENIGSLNGTAIRDELRRLDENSAGHWFRVQNGVGSRFRQDHGNRNISAGAVMMQWQNGRPRAVYPPDLASSPLWHPQTFQPFR